MAFTAEHVSRAQTIHLAAPASRAFPLFEPIDEKQWAAGWEPAMLFPASGAAQEGAVFTTRHADNTDTIWAITSYDPASFHIVYLRVTPGSRVGIIDIRCADAQDGTTHATVTYTFTALSEAGNTFLASFTDAHYQQEMAAWEQAINYALQHGHPLPHH